MMKVHTIAAAALLLSLASVSSAEYMQYNGVDLNQVATIHAPGHMSDNLSVYVGRENLTYKGQTLMGYCVDINQYAGSSDVTELPVSSVHNGSMVAYLFETYGPAVDTNLKAAALGAAIWEVINETGPTYGLSDGAFSLSGNASLNSAANALLTGMPASYTPAAGTKVLFSSTQQDFVVGALCPPEVPEPGTLVLVATGIVGLLVRRRQTA